MALVVVGIIIWLFTYLDEPRGIDEEEEREVEQELAKRRKKRWWHRR